MKGDVAKNSVINKLSNFFGSNYCGVEKNKIYVMEEDGSNGKIQLCLTLTAPKTPVEFGEVQADWNWDDDEPAASPVQTPAKAEVTEEETARIQEMMKRLNL